MAFYATTAAFNAAQQTRLTDNSTGVITGADVAASFVDVADNFLPSRNLITYRGSSPFSTSLDGSTAGVYVQAPLPADTHGEDVPTHIFLVQMITETGAYLDAVLNIQRIGSNTQTLSLWRNAGRGIEARCRIINSVLAASFFFTKDAGEDGDIFFKFSQIFGDAISSPLLRLPTEATFYSTYGAIFGAAFVSHTLADLEAGFAENPPVSSGPPNHILKWS